MFALFCVPWAANAQETLTVYGDGTQTNNAYVPMYGGYFDDFTKSEFVIPAAKLVDMVGGTITSMKFYISSVATYGTGWDNTHQVVFLKEIASTTLSDYSGMDGATIVFDGTLTVPASTDTEFEIEFTTNTYEYQGGNLLVGIYNTDDGSYRTVNWYGEAVTGASGGSSNGNSLDAITFTQRNFIPKTTFTYEPAQSGGDVCDKPATLVAEDVTDNSATLTWTGGSGVYNIELNGTIIEQSYQGYTYDLRDLSATTAYTVKVQSVCNGETPTSTWKSVSFTTPCGTYDIPYTYGFEDAAPFACWTVISGNITCINGTPNTGSYRLDFRGTNSNMIALPQFNEATNNLRVEFWTRPESNGGSSGKFAIGYMTDITDASTFVAVDTYNSTEMTTSYVKKTVDFMNVPADANIAMRQFDCSTNYYWYVDDVTVKEIPSCMAPTGLAANATTTSAELSWTANSGETAWTIYYKKATDESYTEVANVTANPYTLSGLDASSNYEFYVVANCSADDASEPSEMFTFATACDVIAALGYSENFDSYTAGNNVLPTCWNYINTTTYSSYQVYPRVYANSSYSTYANTAPNCLYLYSYYSSWTDYDPQPQYAILPEMDGLNGKQVTLMAKGYTATSTFKIGTMSDPTDVGTFQLIAEQALTTSYDEYSFIVNQEGNYLAIMIDAANESRTSNGAYIDDISIDNAPTCLKPSSPMLETPASRTAHTATLKWTNGEEGQNAWQIAYSTTADFNPDEVTPVDVTTNPATINGLDANTTYYAYVRANCGNDDLSAWSRTKATFTTTAANAAPTGLAVDASSITSESAMVTWTGVATNDYHQSYDLYFSTEATMPEELVAENLITGITAESYELTHLEAETPYYVWVRDNCGNDGLSAWSSRASFTTASRCQTPDGLAESNVTNESATITWNTYGLTEFNLRYGTDGENWNTIEGVNTPYTLDRLTASTTYQVQVQATCADAETWSNVLSFTTACDAIADLPWNENFDAYTGATSSSAPTGYPNDELPNCWQFLNRSNSTSNYPQVFISSISGYSVSGNCLFFKSSSSTPLYAVLPSFEEEIAGLQLTFTYRNEGASTANGTLIVGYMTDPADATTFTTVLTCEQTTTLTEKDVLFPEAPAGSYIAFMYQGGSSNNYYMSIDNVKVDFIPTCTKPTALECTATTATSATLRWTAGANENAWQICLNGDETNLIMAESNPFTVEGLTAATAYTAKVRAYCSADDQSDWSNEVSFATLCEAISTFPWTENFNSLTAGIPTCWDNSEGTTTTESYKWNYYATGHDGAGLRFNSYNNPNNLTNFLKTVSLSLPSDQLMQLSFWYKNPTGGDFSVYISTDGGATHETALATGLTGVSTWTEQPAISLANYAGQEVVIVFKGTSNYGSGDAYIYLDDVTVMEVPSCPMPTELAINYTGGNTAEVTWEGTAETYNIDVDGTVINNVTTPYTLAGLELATTYAVMVQANCEEDETSEWTEAVSFTTDFCMPENQCEITFELTDSYGDGWNGGAGIQVIDVETNAEIGFMTNEDLDGESGYDFSELNTLTLAVCDGREIQFVWVSGSFDDECSYVVKDANGEVIFSGQYSVLLDEPVNYVVNCHASVDCAKILVDAQNPEWNETFEDDAEAAGYVYDPSNPNLWTGVTPACWEYEMYTSASLNQIGDQLDTMPQVYRGFNSTEGGHYSLRMMNRCVYAMPEFDEEYPIENLTMTLKLRQSNSLYRLQVGVVDEQGVFTVVKTLKSGTTMEAKTVSFANCPVSGRIAFRNTLVPGTGMSTDYLDYSYNYIDDINFVIGEEAKAEVSIAEAMESELDIEVYPNPTKDVVNVECTMNNVQCSGIEIVDVYGKIITTVDQTATQINVSGLAAGMYFVRVTTDRGVVTKPFVKK